MNLFKRESSVFYLVYFAILFLILNALFSVNFEENDDVVMLLIASGKYGTAPDNHLVFINFMIGTLLNFFYNVFPEVEWYTLLLVVLNLVSFAFITKLVLGTAQTIRSKAILFLFLTAIFVYSSIALQFTRTAAIVAIAGVSLIYSSKHKYTGAILFVIGSLIRFEAAMLILLLSWPLFLPASKNIKAYFQRKEFKALACALLLTAIGEAVDYSYYRMDAEWKDYVAYNQVRGKINDNPNARLIDSITLPEEVAPNDYQLLLIALADPQSLTIEHLEKIHHAIGNKSFFQKLGNIKYIKRYDKFLLLFAALSALFFLQNKENRMKNLFIIFTFISLMAYITLDATLKGRVFFPALFGVMFFLILFNQCKAGKITNLILTVLLIFSLAISYISYRMEEVHSMQRVTFDQQTKVINEYVKEDKKLIPIGTSYRMEYGNPFRYYANFPAQKVLFGGWLTNSPFNKGTFDTYEFFIDGYGILVSKDMEKKVGLILKSISDNYGIELTSNIVLEKQDLLVIELNTVANH